MSKRVLWGKNKGHFQTTGSRGSALIRGIRATPSSVQASAAKTAGPSRRIDSEAWLIKTAGIHAARIASAQIGKHEVPYGSNRGPQVSKWITRSGGTPGGENGAWCQYFANNIFYEHAGYWWTRSGSTGAVYAAKVGKHGVRSRHHIMPGDWLYWGNTHVMIALSKPDHNGTVKIVGGNQGRGAVTVAYHDMNSFYGADANGNRFHGKYASGVLRPPYPWY